MPLPHDAASGGGVEFSYSFRMKGMPAMPAEDACQLCREAGGETLWQDERCRLVLVADADYPGFCRVVWKRHVAEMTDLDAAERRHLMSVVFDRHFPNPIWGADVREAGPRPAVEGAVLHAAFLRSLAEEQGGK